MDEQTKNLILATGLSFLVLLTWMFFFPPEPIPENLTGNIRLACHVIPKLRNGRMVRVWLGLEAETDDALPIIGDLPGIPNAYVIGSVHSGYTSGPYMGKLLSQLIMGQEPEMPLFDPKRLIKQKIKQPKK